MKKSTIRALYPCFGTPQYTAGSSICEKCQHKGRCSKIVKREFPNHKKYFQVKKKKRNPKKHLDERLCICGHNHFDLMEKKINKICYEVNCLCIVFRKCSNYKQKRWKDEN